MNGTKLPQKEIILVSLAIFADILSFVLAWVYGKALLFVLFFTILIASSWFLKDQFRVVWKLIFSQATMRIIKQLVEDFEVFHSSAVKTIGNYNQYLTTLDKRALKADCDKFTNRLKAFGSLWDEETKEVRETLSTFEKTVQTYNEVYVNKQKERFRFFFDGTEYNQQVELNEDQIDAIVVNDNNNLVVAGPGSGKTRVLVDRVAFYIIKKKIPIDQILVMAYNRGAVAEIRERLAKIYDIHDVEVRTFHSLGFKVVNRFKGEKEIRVEQNTRRRIRELIELKKAEDPIFQHLYINYFRRISEYVDEDDENVTRKMYSHQESKPYEALDGTRLKSIAEKDIANFFITHDIYFIYEKRVEWCDSAQDKSYHPDFYLPDFDVYLEHWGITDSSDSRYNPVIKDVEKYRKDMEWKKEQFEKHNKVLLQTNYDDWKNEKLEEKLLDIAKFLWGILDKEIVELSPEEIIKIIDNLPHKSKILSDLIHQTIMDAKIYGYNSKSLSDYVRSKKLSRKNHAYLSLVFPIFETYEDFLGENNKIDYQDMINQAVEHLEGLVHQKKGDFCVYSMIFIDEFQDISYQRLRLLQELQKMSLECRMFSVGDDWQSIYGFSGASNKYMVKLAEYFKPITQTILKYNYRNPKTVIEFSSDHIQECSDFIPKKLVGINDYKSPSMNISRIPGGKYKFEAEEHRQIIDLIKRLLKEGVDPSEIMILSRFNFWYADLKKNCEEGKEIPVALIKGGKMVRKGIRFHSIHRAKGLEAEYIVIMNVSKGLYGLPSELSSSFDHKLINPDLPDELDEERRIFYVALTRAKKEVYLYTQLWYPSEFLDKIPSTKEEYLATLGSKTGTYKIEATIVNSTDQAICCRVKNDFQENIDLWLPKSVTHIDPDKSPEENQIIYIERNFVEKYNNGPKNEENNELDKRYNEVMQKARNTRNNLG